MSIDHLSGENALLKDEIAQIEQHLKTLYERLRFNENEITKQLQEMAENAHHECDLCMGDCQ